MKRLIFTLVLVVFSFGAISSVQADEYMGHHAEKISSGSGSDSGED
jgi:hypothetical protein